MKEIKNCRFLKRFNINAIVLYPFVLYCDPTPGKRITSHERVHLEQIKKDGVVTFYVRYLFEYVRGRINGLTHDESYRSISYEVEAYSKELKENS